MTLEHVPISKRCSLFDSESRRDLGETCDKARDGRNEGNGEGVSLLTPLFEFELRLCQAGEGAYLRTSSFFALSVSAATSCNDTRALDRVET